MLQAIRGPNVTFEDLYRSEYQPMVRAIAVLTGSRDEAEDAVQEAFLRAHRSWSVIENHPSPAAWVHLTASRVAIGGWRQWRRRVGGDLRDATAQLPGHDESLRVSIFQALQTLDHSSRTVVYLYYFADVSVSGISQLMSKPEGTIKSLLSRSRAKLEQELTT